LTLSQFVQNATIYASESANVNVYAGNMTLPLGPDPFYNPPSPSPSSSSDAWIWILIVLVIIIALGAAYYFYRRDKMKKEEAKGLVYSMSTEQDNSLLG
jgi:hypothetical protein